MRCLPVVDSGIDGRWGTRRGLGGLPPGRGVWGQRPQWWCKGQSPHWSVGEAPELKPKTAFNDVECQVCPTTTFLLIISVYY